MCSRFLSLTLFCCLGYGATLRVCADPNNLPFSNKQGQGFENRIAELLARDTNSTLSYTWWLQRRNFVKNTINAGKCDVIVGFPAGSEGVLTTRPYYRSSYVFVTRHGTNVRSLDDPSLHRLKIAAHVIDDNFTPPAHALARRGIRNVKGYSLFGAYGEENPPAHIVQAVSKGEVDVAVVWGPIAGYFGGKDLEVVPVSPSHDGPIPFAFDISVAVRRDNPQLRDRIQQVLIKERRQIDSILKEYHVPIAGGS